jgi:hypothetical protein
VVSVSFVLAVGGPSTCSVAASVVTTLAADAASVGVRIDKPVHKAAVPAAAVSVSVNVLAVKVAKFPFAPGAPDLLPTVNRNPEFDGDVRVDTPAESTVKVYPASETAFVNGNATSVPFV